MLNFRISYVNEVPSEVAKFGQAQAIINKLQNGVSTLIFIKSYLIFVKGT